MDLIDSCCLSSVAKLSEGNKGSTCRVCKINTVLCSCLCSYINESMLLIMFVIVPVTCNVCMELFDVTHLLWKLI